jgi:hypothetical protein
LIARQCRDKVWFPGSAAIIGKRLFNVVGIWSNVRPDESNKDSPPVERFLVEEFATAVLELADLRLIHYTHCAVDKVLTPLMRLRIIEEQCEAFEMSGRTIGLDLLQLRAAIPNLPDVHRSIQIHPVVGARKWMLEAADMGLPCPYVEIEIVLPVPQLAGR